jgi:hypothetical protein
MFYGSTSFFRARIEDLLAVISLVREPGEDMEHVEHVEQRLFSTAYVFHVF